MDYLIDLKKQNLSGKVALEGGISLGVDTDGNIKKIDESGAISDIGGSVDESRLLPENPANGDIPCFDATATVGEWGKFNKSNLVLKSDLPSPREDIVFTSTSLSNSKLTVENATVGTFAILDNSNSLVMPNMKQVDTSVEIDFTGWTVTGNWTIKFVSNTCVSGGGGGVTKAEATSIAIEAAIIFG